MESKRKRKSEQVFGVLSKAKKAFALLLLYSFLPYSIRVGDIGAN